MIINLKAVGVAIVVFAMVVAALATGGGAAAHSDKPGEIEPDSAHDDVDLDPGRFADNLEAVARSRARFGFDASDALVKELANDKEAIARGADWGFPATEAEAKEMVTRLDLQETSQPVFDVAAKLAPETFAGVWMDVATGSIVASYTDLGENRRVADERLAELTGVAKYRDRVRIESQEFTLAELDRVFSDLRAERLQGSSYQVAGLRVGSVSLQPMKNRIFISIEPVDLARVDGTDAAAEALGRHLGVSSKMFVVDEYTGEEELGAARGGHRIGTGANGAVSNSGGCSVAGHVSNSSGNFFVVTAGHCAGSAVPEVMRHTQSGLAGNTLHNPQFYKQVSNWEVNGTTANPTNADVQIMRHGWPSWTPQPSRQIANWHGNDYRLQSVVQPGDIFDRVGDLVCQAGHNTGGISHCGAIDSVEWDCGSHIDMRQVDLTVVGGDSGGTVYSLRTSNRKRIAGVVEGLCSGDSRYTFQADALAAVPGTFSWYKFGN